LFSPLICQKVYVVALFSVNKKGKLVIPVSASEPEFVKVFSPGVDSKESIPPAYIAWRAGTT
jgi:hypothetical protein